jgi:hypothetical protein
MSEPSQDKDLQGEGNYDAARRYDKAATDFAKSGKVDKAAHAAAPADGDEAEAMKQAEAEGASHSKGESADTSPAGSAKPKP